MNLIFHARNPQEPPDERLESGWNPMFADLKD